MSQFSIRETNATATWKQEVQNASPNLSEWWHGAKVSAQKMGASQNAFQAFFNDQIGALRSFVPLKNSLKFEQAAQQKYNEIIQASFATSVGEVTKSQASAILSKANKAALESIETLASSYMVSDFEWGKEVDTAIKGHGPTGVDPSAFKNARQQVSEYVDARIERMHVAIEQDGALSPEQKSQRHQQLLLAAEDLKGELYDKLTTGLMAAKKEVDRADEEQRKNLTGDQVFRSDFHATVRDVHIAATRGLMKLTQDHARPDYRPQLQATANGLSVIRPVPTLENLVLAGGGAKGVGNPPALTELGPSLLPGLKKIVGTSAGALTASLLASGMSTAALQDMMNRTPMNDLKQDVANFDRLYPGLNMITGDGSMKDRMLIRAAAFSGVDNSAQRVVQLLDQYSAQLAHDYVSQHIDFINASVPGRITQQEAENLIAKFQDAPNFETDRSNKMLTFGDLATLHKLDPTKFKELTLTGYNVTNNRVDYFDKTTAANMPIAFAGRISMSIPIYFQSIDSGGTKYVDGGIGSNVPAEVVIKNDATKQDATAKTMLMVFDESGRAFSTMFTSGNLEANDPPRNEDVAHGIMQRTTGADFANTDVQDRKKTYASGPNVHVVFHGNVNTFDLSASLGKQLFAKQIATLRTLEQIEARQNQAYQVSVQNVDALIPLLTDKERQAIIASSRPTAQEYPKAADLQVAQELWDKLRPAQQ